MVSTYSCSSCSQNVRFLGKIHLSIKATDFTKRALGHKCPFHRCDRERWVEQKFQTIKIKKLNKLRPIYVLADNFSYIWWKQSWHCVWQNVWESLPRHGRTLSLNQIMTRISISKGKWNSKEIGCHFIVHYVTVYTCKWTQFANFP